MGFNASEVVESLDYDFTAFGGGKGTIPEPSQSAVEAYQKEISAAVKSVSDIPSNMDNLSPEDAQRLMEKMDDVDISQISGQIKQATANLCSNTPSVEELDRLPYRVFQAFQQWLQGELSPEHKTAATKPSLGIVRGG